MSIFSCQFSKQILIHNILFYSVVLETDYDIYKWVAIPRNLGTTALGPLPYPVPSPVSCNYA